MTDDPEDPSSDDIKESSSAPVSWRDDSSIYNFAPRHINIAESAPASWRDDSEIYDFAPRGMTIAGHKARTQNQLALFIFILISTLSVALLVGIAFKWWTAADAKDIAAFLLVPIVAIFGTIVGFYYGDRK